MINPVFRPLRAFADSRGYSHFDIFNGPCPEGQINIGHLYSPAIKAFHYHQYQEDNWFCVKGNIHVIAALPIGEGKFDIRHFYMGENNPGVLTIPKWWYHGYCNVGCNESTLLYWVTKPYNATEPDEYRVAWDVFGADIWKPENK